MKKYTLKDFQKQFPNDDVCLEWLKDYFYPNGIFCDTCQDCYQTPQSSFTPKLFLPDLRSPRSPDRRYYLSQVIYASYVVGSTPYILWLPLAAVSLPNNWSANWVLPTKPRGVCSNKSDLCLPEDDATLSNAVEVDETYDGAKKSGKRGRGAENKTIIAGALERDGSVITKIVPNVRRETLIPFHQEHVELNTHYLYRRTAFLSSSQRPRLSITSA